MSKFVNMTSHPINIQYTTEDGHIEAIVIEPSGDLIRLKEHWTEVDIVNNVPIVHCMYSSEVDLPEQIENTFYIVSAMVANAFPDRFDFVIPAQTIRDEDGWIIGCTALAVVNYSWVINKS